MKKILILIIVLFTLSSCKTIKTKNQEPSIEKFIEIDNAIRDEYFKDYSIEIPETWFSYIGHHVMAHAPREFENTENIPSKSTFYVVENSINDLDEDKTFDNVLRQKVKKYKKYIRAFKYELIKANHPVYGEFYYLKYKMTNYKNEITIHLDAVIMHNKKHYSLYYSSKIDFYEKFLDDAVNMTLSFRVKE